ncbi:MAG: ribosomal RNA small subunit methyltransferase A [Candidatus Liptonbacteria bacterium]|nr:ribosomal RNA small subunit methyltransferase A [Candidatus Liptonbacteria bacterium]
MRQKLGQHFLKDKNAIGKIVEALELKDLDTVIEVGAGHGELTEKLKIKNQRLKIVAIEKDLELGDRLKVLGFSEEGGDLKIVIGDVLKVLEPITYNLKPKTWKLVGNIPYYITGYLLRIISELENKPELTVLTIQKEVAERMVARPPRMNRLAASVQFWAEPEIVARVPKTSFAPAPEVESAVIKLKNKNEKIKIKDEDYYKTVKVLFQQPRKTILNNLVADLHADPTRGFTSKEEIGEKLKSISVDPNSRPQDLRVEDIIKLAEIR